MKISILLPVHNDEKFIERTIVSLIDQTYQDFLCLIGFNGTIDSSKEIVGRMVDGDNRFILFDFGNDKGKSITLNKLLNEVETEVFCLIDGDDIWEQRKLETQIGISDQYDVIGTLACYIDENDNIFNHLKLDENSSRIRDGILRGHNQIINSSCMVKTSDALSIGGWDSEVDGLEDFDFWVKLYSAGKTFYNIQEYLVHHRIHKGSNFNAKELPYTVYDILKRNKVTC
jgi:teichuronic acid biosynthesis glycosyltransferase TuaG